ncbi:MAG: hypothetical protein LJE94_14770 [Deltaproteobacteria bacterium]|nr:hypothetical protein [Deltaproteobacteria bacterium]
MQTQHTAESSLKNGRTKRGRFYFSREAERKFFFVATMLMLVAGVLFKIGLF